MMRPPITRMILLLLAGCVEEGVDVGVGSARLGLDVEYFSCAVHPVLVSRCAFPACHGNEDRPFKLYWGAGMRLDPDLYNQPTSDEERAANHEAALAFAGDSPDDSWLLLKPLDWNQGGYYHRGAWMYGTWDVFSSTSDPGYQAIESWILGAAGPCPSADE